MTAHQFVKTPRFEFECFSFGNGPNFMLAFNGFNEDASKLKVLNKSIGTQYTIVAVNLPFHGKTKVIDESDAIMQNEDIETLVNTLVSLCATNKVSLFGYSLGAKVALQITELMPNLIEKLILFAPDGILNNQWYNAVVKYRITRKLYLSIVQRPTWFLDLVKAFYAVRLIPLSLKRFVFIQLETKSKRQMVYNVWVCLKHIVPEIDVIKNNIRSNDIQVQLFFGEKDKIIPLSAGKMFVEGLEDWCSLKVVDAGHQLVNEEYLSMIK